MVGQLLVRGPVEGGEVRSGDLMLVALADKRGLKVDVKCCLCAIFPVQML
jgi:hypothetical protein